ncbi:hypothetical protein HPP92_007630 [Vanilla planifolia]|uniref:Uncharacterized protein n=1 Tax=Vanilla planifolia TaxID=51239 RepID=A0A835RRJ8_VANPL|nr:hypothetical protein HPP92_007630 [Vanilla planifolia]
MKTGGGIPNPITTEIGAGGGRHRVLRPVGGWTVASGDRVQVKDRRSQGKGLEGREEYWSGQGSGVNGV